MPFLLNKGVTLSSSWVFVVLFCFCFVFVFLFFVELICSLTDVKLLLRIIECILS